MKINLTKKQFNELITKIIKEINAIHHDTYTLELNDERAVVGRKDVFYFTYMDTFLSLKTLYDITMYFKCEEDNPVLIIYNN